MNQQQSTPRKKSSWESIVKRIAQNRKKFRILQKESQIRAAKKIEQNKIYEFEKKNEQVNGRVYERGKTKIFSIWKVYKLCQKYIPKSKGSPQRQFIKLSQNQNNLQSVSESFQLIESQIFPTQAQQNKKQK